MAIDKVDDRFWDGVDFDGMFDKVVKDPTICELIDIDTSKPGWEVILTAPSMDHLNKQRVKGGDYWRLEQWEALGDFMMKLERVPNVKIKLSHSEDSVREGFTDEQIALFQKYNPLARAPEGIRKAVNVEIMDVFDDEIELIDEELEKLQKFQFEAVSMLVQNGPEADGIIAVLESIAAKNNLSIEIGFAEDARQVCLYKLDAGDYQGKEITEDDLEFIKALGFELIL